MRPMTNKLDEREPMHIHTMLAAALLAATPAWAINKCKTPEGKTVFQDAPCAGQGEKIEVRPASGYAVRAPVSAASAPASPQAAAPAATAKKEGAFGESWRRKTDLESHLISNTRAALNGHLRDCEAQQRQLASKKGQARNNLAGATWEQSISAEMQAAATTCDTKARDMRARLEGYEKELRELQATR